MNIFVETSLSNLYMCIFDSNNKIISKINIENVVKKTDIFYEQLNILLKIAKLKLFDIKNFYVTLGPGSFSGARIGLTFCRTVFQLSKKCNLYVTPTYKLFNTQLKTNHVKILANKYRVFDIIDDNITLETNNNDYHIFDYDRFENNLSEYLLVFKKIERDKLLDVDVIYGSMPQIGEIKC